MAEPITFGPWPKGMNNLKADYELEDDEARQITNFDVTDSGRLRLRKDKTVVYTGSDRVHSLYTDKTDTIMFVEGDTLKKLNADYTATTLKTGCEYGRRMFYAEPGDGKVYFSNGATTGTIRNGVVGAWGVPVPAYSPVLTASVGALDAGWYQVLITYTDANGNESGSQVIPSRISVASNGGFIVGLQTAAPSGVAFIHVYCTEANSTTFFHHSTVSVGVSSLLIASPPKGSVLRTQGMIPFPACQLLQWYKGSMVGAQGSNLLLSPPLMHGLFDPARGYLMFDSNIQVVAAGKNGLWVATETETNWIAGSYSEGFERDVKLPYGGAFGSLYPHPNNTDFIWFSPKGFIVGDDDGKAEPLHDSAVAVGNVTEAAVVTKEQDGLRQAVAVPLKEAYGSAFTIGDYAEAVVRRKNTEV